MEARGVGTRPASAKEFKASVGYVRFYLQKHAERMMVIKEESRRKSSMYMSIYLNIYVHHIQVIPTKVRADTGSPELELQVVGSGHVGAGNQTWILWKNS